MKAGKNKRKMCYYILAYNPVKCNCVSTKRPCELRVQSVTRDSNSSFGSTELWSCFLIWFNKLLL